MKINNESDQRVTSEKPVKIPLDFKEALEVLLDTKPEDIDEADRKEKESKKKTD